MNAMRKWGPRRCFYEHDLYSTHFGTAVNDEIEKYLFGSIDERGAKAVRAFAGGDLSSMHDSFKDFFEYLDAQKLRTPKGLDWIKSRYSLLDQKELMREMQGLRLMHYTMWTEGVREIVSAEDSDVKFILTDHPVTVYNAALPPESPECRYPEDPPIESIGTQTVFPLDANTCLILTHLEYAQDPNAANLTSPRTHARYRGQSLVRTDAFIRKRKFSRDEVIAINHVLKSRARRYIAALIRSGCTRRSPSPAHGKSLRNHCFRKTTCGNSVVRFTWGTTMDPRSTRTHLGAPPEPTNISAARNARPTSARMIFAAAEAAANSSVAVRTWQTRIVHHGMSTVFGSEISCSADPSRTPWDLRKGKLGTMFVEN